MKLKKILSSILVCSLALSLVACSSSNGSSSDDSVEKIILGTSADYPPYEFKKNINGKDEFVGFDIELAKEVAKDLGKELEIVDMPFKTLLLELDAGKVDFVISGLSPTPERAEQVDLSKIYYKATQCVVTLSDNAATYSSIESLVSKNVGAQLGSIQQGIVEDQMPESMLLSLDKVPNLILELKSGGVDAIVMEEPVARTYIEQYPELAVAFEIEDPTEGGSVVAVKKGNEDLLGTVNATIDRVLGDGSFDKYVEDAFILANE